MGTKKLIIVYFFSFGETSYERLKMSKRDTCSMTSLGRVHDVNLGNFHKTVF